MNLKFLTKASQIMKSIESKWYFAGDCLPGETEWNVLVRLVYCIDLPEESGKEWNANLDSEFDVPREWIICFCYAQYEKGRWILDSVPEDSIGEKDFRFNVTHWSTGIWEKEDEEEYE